MVSTVSMVSMRFPWFLYRIFGFHRFSMVSMVSMVSISLVCVDFCVVSIVSTWFPRFLSAVSSASIIGYLGSFYLY